MDSVLSQDYPNFEYIVVDGGSTDGTLNVIERYQQRYPGRLRLVTGPDDGAADAVQKGLRMARGEIFAFLNADDTYYPGALHIAAGWLIANPDVAGIYGNAHWIDEDHNRIGTYPTKAFSREALADTCYICQPACFLRTSALREVGGLNTAYQVAFDYELWLRLSQRYTLRHIDVLLANSRMHVSNKTLRQRAQGFRDAMRALLRFHGYIPLHWVHSYVSYLLDGRDQFFEELRPTFTKFIVSTLVGTVLNWRQPLRFWRESLNVMSFGALVRRWNDTWLARQFGLRIPS